jgi:hypothetical protein
MGRTSRVRVASTLKVSFGQTAAPVPDIVDGSLYILNKLHYWSIGFENESKEILGSSSKFAPYCMFSATEAGYGEP